MFRFFYWALFFVCVIRIVLFVIGAESRSIELLLLLFLLNWHHLWSNLIPLTISVSFIISTSLNSLIGRSIQLFLLAKYRILVCILLFFIFGRIIVISSTFIRRIDNILLFLGVQCSDFLNRFFFFLFLGVVISIIVFLLFRRWDKLFSCVIVVLSVHFCCVDVIVFFLRFFFFLLLIDLITSILNINNHNNDPNNPCNNKQSSSNRTYYEYFSGSISG